MFKFKFEPDISLLTVVRKGNWSLGTVRSYETSLRRELLKLNLLKRPTSFIIDIRSSGAQTREVAEALRAMVARLGNLHADRTAVVTASGLAKLQAKRVADDMAEVFTSMVLARDWVTGRVGRAPAIGTVYDVPSDAEAEVGLVHIQGPDGVDVMLTAAAALETGRRIDRAAVEALLQPAPAAPKPGKLAV